MVARCAVCGAYRHNDYLSFFRFPIKNPDLLHRWFVKLRPWHLTYSRESARICHLHFHPKDVKIVQSVTSCGETLRRHLVPDAVPLRLTRRLMGELRSKQDEWQDIVKGRGEDVTIVAKRLLAEVQAITHPQTNSLGIGDSATAGEQQGDRMDMDSQTADKLLEPCGAFLGDSDMARVGDGTRSHRSSEVANCDIEAYPTTYISKSQPSTVRSGELSKVSCSVFMGRPRYVRRGKLEDVVQRLKKRKM